MLKCYASDEGFEQLNFLVEMFAAYKNNHMFFDLIDIPELELAVEIKAIEGLIREIMEVGEL